MIVWLLMSVHTPQKFQRGLGSLAQSLVRYCQRCTGFRCAAIDPKRPRYAKGIPRLCSFLFTVPNSPFAEIPIKKTYPNLFRKESGSDMNYMVGIAGLEPASPKTGDFKSPVSANFTISPGEMKKTVFLAKHRFLWYTIRDSNPGHPD